MVYRATSTHSGRDYVFRFVPASAIGSQDRVTQCLKSSILIGRATSGRVVPLADAIQAGDAVAIVTRFIQGVSLDRIISDRRKEGNIPPDLASADLDRTLHSLDQVIDRVATIHAAGERFPELRPSNILIDSHNAVWLMDFMLSRLLYPNNPMLAIDHISVGDSQSSYLEPSIRVANVSFVAPEEWSGRKRADQRADVFRLGVVAYQALTLRLPYKSMVTEHQHRQPPGIRALQPAVSPELDSIVLRALCPQPEGRYLSATDMAVEWRRLRNS
jgi:serine/threonine protein kinase